jgi:hypothetical protein
MHLFQEESPNVLPPPSRLWWQEPYVCMYDESDAAHRERDILLYDTPTFFFGSRLIKTDTHTHRMAFLCVILFLQFLSTYYTRIISKRRHTSQQGIKYKKQYSLVVGYAILKLK